MVDHKRIPQEVIASKSPYSRHGLHWTGDGEAFHSLGMSITMVKPGPRLLAFMPEEMASVVKHELFDKGIDVTGCRSEGN